MASDSPSALQNKLRRFFDDASIARGNAYYADGAVKNLQIAHLRAQADVQGTSPYVVSLDWTGDLSGHIFSSCNCLHFQGGNFCKHIWAVILELDELPQLPASLMRRNLVLVFRPSAPRISIPIKAATAAARVKDQLPSSWRDVMAKDNRASKRLHLKVTASPNGYLLDVNFETDGAELVPLRDLQFSTSPRLYRIAQRPQLIELSSDEENWLGEFSGGPLVVPPDDEENFLDAVLNRGLKYVLPPELEWERALAVPTAHIELSAGKNGGRDRYFVDIPFQYGPRVISHWSSNTLVASSIDRKIYSRDRTEEERVEALVPMSLCVRRRPTDRPILPARHLVEFASAALAANLPVMVESKKLSTATDFQLSVTSNLDWFDVSGQASFDGAMVTYPEILEAVGRGERFIPLPDGSHGLIDDRTAHRLEKLASFAENRGGSMRFTKAQGLLLNSLLESEANVEVDRDFSALREKIKSFPGIRAIEPVAAFQGQLREYQREGLGWLEFLQNFGLGGILADDMGLGKTVQCLAFLISRQKDAKKPSLLLAPKSLLENWRLEAAKFTPELKVLVHSGIKRQTSSAAFLKQDLVVTTYQTMLRDIDTFRKISWDCVVADEAQAIKNSGALVAKAAKLLPAEFRLALTGTPIENSIQDLFSISDFVNPGFLQGKRRRIDPEIGEETRRALASAFKPVVLRRTKAQVLKDLPGKTEQIIRVDLEPKQLKVYQDLKKFYRAQLMKEVRQNGVQKSQIQILSALTRLRQAALHPGLIDPNQSSSESAKFGVVLEMLEEIISENQRVLIFSQFTSLLALLKPELRSRNIEFAYLDGKTTKRQEVVEGFRSSTCPVFLMSLKAGGVGLNLVEANYVFLLDPWWNPAVESQAIDRVHRIGQKRAVNAYRFIAKDTVEEKILDLQASKRGLSDEILGEKSSPLRNMTAQDIENLFA